MLPFTYNNPGEDHNFINGTVSLFYQLRKEGLPLIRLWSFRKSGFVQLGSLELKLVQIDDARQLTTKYDELKRQGLFIRSSLEFYKTDWIADSSTGLSLLSSDAVLATHLLNPDTHAGFYIIRHNDSTST